MTARDLSVGVDLGTSGIRSAVLDVDGTVLATAKASYPDTNPDYIDARVWWRGAANCITAQIATLRDLGINPARVARIGVDGTSGSMVLTDATLTPVTRGLMYNSSGFTAEASLIAQHAPDPHISRGSNSATARALRLVAQDTGNRAVHLLHQADYIAAMLMGRGGFSDDNNALKTGYDPETGVWPDWFDAIGLAKLVPTVLPAGAIAAPIAQNVAAALGLPEGTDIHVGTTDSTAAFLAAAPMKIGAAVTSLGTTLAIKILSDTRIEAPEIGLYSHRVGGGWLVGGASNTGGGVLKSLFTVDELTALSAQIDPASPGAYNYYPLLQAGERFPINDPDLKPRMTPRPDSDVDYLYGLLSSIARIEAQCYEEIAARGGPRPTPLFTAGGGASNPVWTKIRARLIGCDIQTASQTEAAVGTARLISLKAD